MGVIVQQVPEQLHVYQLLEGPLAGQTFYGAHKIVCLNPTCPCTDMLFRLWRHVDGERQGSTEESCRILINVGNRRLSTGRPVADITNDVSLSEAFVANLTEAHWNVLYVDLLRQRRALLRDSKSLESAHFDFADMEEAIELESEAIPFDTVFPFAESFDLEVRGVRVTFFDQYCVNPRCSCTNAILSAYPTFDSVDQTSDESIEPLFTVSHDYRTHVATMLDDFSANSDLFLRAPKADLRKISTIVKTRHRIMRSVYRGYRDRADAGRRNVGTSSEGLVVPRFRNDPPIEGTFVSGDDLSRAKVGRNEPCPCGSGRKYKHCCGR